MKKIKILTALILINLIINAQPPNLMKYTEYRLNGNRYLDTLYFDIDTCVDKGYLNVRFGDSIVNHWPEPMIYNVSNDFALIPYELGVRLTVGEATDLTLKDYDSYDTTLTAMTNLIFSSFDTHKKYQYEFVLRLSSKLDGSTASKMNDTCFAKLYYSSLEVPEFEKGKLIGYNETDGIAYLQSLTNPNISYNVDINTLALKTQKIAEYFGKVKN